MASADLTAPSRQRTPGLTGWQTFALTLTALWAVTLAAAGLGALPALIAPRLQLHPHAIPSMHAALVTWAHNVRVAGWPLVFAAAGLYRQRWQRQLGDLLLAASLIVNGAIVGAAVAAGHDRILPYLIHLPIEWAAMALSASGWLLASRTRLTRRQLAVTGVAFVVLLALAAVLETYAVPHL